MKRRVARQLKWFQQQLSAQAVPKWCERSDQRRPCPLCELPFGVGHMLVKCYTLDAAGAMPEWVHVKCAQYLISTEGFDDQLHWRKE
eukprot:3282677-Rhodomonas_salina.1